MISVNEALVADQPVVHVENLMRGSGLVLTLVLATSGSHVVHAGAVAVAVGILASFSALAFIST